MPKLPSARKDAPSPKKAAEMLKHGEVHGHKLTAPQRKFFGAVAGKGKKSNH